MNALATRQARFATPAPAPAPAPAPIRNGAAEKSPEIYPEALYLRQWAANQAARYHDLLLTITAAPKPAGGR